MCSLLTGCVTDGKAHTTRVSEVETRPRLNVTQMKKDRSTVGRGEARLQVIFADEKTTAAILNFIKRTDIGKKVNQDDKQSRGYSRRENIGIVYLDNPVDP